jgi:hypothetical protein
MYRLNIIIELTKSRNLTKLSVLELKLSMVESTLRNDLHLQHNMPVVELNSINTDIIQGVTSSMVLCSVLSYMVNLDCILLAKTTKTKQPL